MILQKCGRCGEFLTAVDAELYNKVFPEKKMQGCICEDCLTRNRPTWALKTGKQFIKRLVNHFLPFFTFILCFLSIPGSGLGIISDDWLLDNQWLSMWSSLIFLISIIVCPLQCIKEFNIEEDEVVVSGYRYETTYSYDPLSDTVTGNTKKDPVYAGGEDLDTKVWLFLTYIFWSIPVWAFKEIKMLIARKKGFTKNFVRAWRKVKAKKGAMVFIGKVSYNAYLEKCHKNAKKEKEILKRYQDSTDEVFSKITNNHKEKELKKLKKPVLKTTKGKIVCWHRENFDFVYREKNGTREKYFVVKNNVRLYSTKAILREDIMYVLETEEPFGWNSKYNIE